MQPFLTYAAIGDSLTIGLGSDFMTGFVPMYAHMLNSVFHIPVVTKRYAKIGLTSTDVIKMLINRQVRSEIAQADVITITVGGNDLLHANALFNETNNPIFFEVALQHLGTNLYHIIKYIQNIKSCMNDQPYFIRIIGLYNPYQELSYSHYWVQTFNDVLRSYTSANVAFVDIYPIFRMYGTHALSPDGLHPNGIGYQLIATQLAKTGYNPLVR
ncbi:GDSL-type esterase/lipase family protein [Halalkalibacterium ligniniphilum]|uniref:GDSL-type esterase/lipase family protein n=1 Tax=Halalkalibacterium ligniniphilum TaxID=1134413 RepID=UPI00034DACAA|nr:GDSL-type esterase/lipase family protein [Halalkalibacterium ligniniphilum]